MFVLTHALQSTRQSSATRSISAPCSVCRRVSYRIASEVVSPSTQQEPKPMPFAHLAVLAMLLVLTGCIGGNSDCESLPIRIELDISADTLTPSDPSVCRDQEVTLVVAPAVDGVIHVHGYDEQVPATSVAAGEVTELVFTATRAGQFPIEFHTDDNIEGASVGVFTVNEP